MVDHNNTSMVGFFVNLLLYYVLRPYVDVYIDKGKNIDIVT